VTPDSDAAFIVADLITEFLLKQVRGRLYIAIYEQAFKDHGGADYAKLQADEAVRNFDKAFAKPASVGTVEVDVR
jgi:hypothetical protein